MKKNKLIRIILGVVLSATIGVGLWFGVKALTKDTADPSATDSTASAPTGETGETGTTGELSPEVLAVKTKDVYTVDDLAPDDSRLDLTVAECGSVSLTNRQAQVYYFIQFYSFMNQYGSYAAMIGLDDTKPLSEQPSGYNDLSWEQSFLLSGIEQFHQTAVLVEKANAEGFTMPEEDRASLEQHLADMEKNAEEYGFESVDAMIQADFGACVGFEDYKQFIQNDMLAYSYEQYMESNLTWTDEELEAFYTTYPVNVRHILFLYDGNEDGTATEEEKAEAKEKAEQMLEQVRSDPSEEAFAALANEHSQDGGSNTNGGLYEDVLPGVMVQSFNDWCFDDARQVGDIDIVETEYGYHVMFFAGRATEWSEDAIAKASAEKAKSILEELIAASTLTVRYEDIVLSPVALRKAE